MRGAGVAGLSAGGQQALRKPAAKGVALAGRKGRSTKQRREAQARGRAQPTPPPQLRKPSPWARNAPGGCPMVRLKARLKAASEP
ncbi:hypothetical protein MJ547_26735, partial [Burkholderia gladioli]